MDNLQTSIVGVIAGVLMVMAFWEFYQEAVGADLTWRAAGYVTLYLAFGVCACFCGIKMWQEARAKKVQPSNTGYHPGDNRAESPTQRPVTTIGLGKRRLRAVGPRREKPARVLRLTRE